MAVATLGKRNEKATFQSAVQNHAPRNESVAAHKTAPDLDLTRFLNLEKPELDLAWCLGLKFMLSTDNVLIHSTHPSSFEVAPPPRLHLQSPVVHLTLQYL